MEFRRLKVLADNLEAKLIAIVAALVLILVLQGVKIQLLLDRTGAG